MDTAISIQPITNSQFLSVCNYITSFGLFLNSLGFIKTDERYQTVPALNALFKYLNKFENQSKSKIQFLQVLFNETVNDYIGENKTLIDIKIAEEHYRYVINTALFSHYGYITGYLAEIINKKDNITSSILKQKVFRHLPEKYINNDHCFLLKGSSKLTLLAIERIFEDYILPIFTQAWTARENLSDGQRGDFQQLKRSKRNPSEDSDYDWLRIDDSYKAETNDYNSHIPQTGGDTNILNHASNNSADKIEDLSEISESFTNNGPIKRIWKKNNCNIPSKVRKVESKESGSKSEISDEVQHLHDNSTKKKLLTSLKQGKETKVVEYDNFFILLMTIKQIGLSVLRKDEEAYKKFTSQIKALAAQQRKEEWMKEGIELWLRKPIEELTQFECLANLKEKVFSFEDITLLTRRKSGHLPHHLFRPYSTNFELHVLYHVTSDTQYGFVDLGRFDANFTDLFITFPDVIFTVTNMTTHVEKDRRTAILQLKRNPPTQQDWYNDENEESEFVNEAGGLKSVSDSAEVQHDDIPSTSKKALATMERNNAEKEGNKRMQAIQRAANFISSTDCKPMWGDYKKSVHMLKSYLLKLEQSDSDTFDVPTYGKLAEDYCENNLKVPECYTRWWIKSGKYVDDVLFQNIFNFPKVHDFHKGSKKINSYSFMNNLDDCYKNYRRNLSALLKTIRVEDFCNIQQAIRRKELIPHHKKCATRNTTLAAFYRLCLKQCNEKWDPVTIYQAKMLSEYFVKNRNNFSLKSEHTVHQFERFSLFPNIEVRDLSKTLSENSLKMLLLKIELKDNVCDIVDIGRVTAIEKGSHVFLLKKKFYVNGTTKWKIENQEVLVVNLLPKMEAAKEDRMVSIVNKLNTIITTETKFYFDEN